MDSGEMDDDAYGYYVDWYSADVYVRLSGTVECAPNDVYSTVEDLCNGHLVDVIDIEDNGDGGYGITFEVEVHVKWPSGSIDIYIESTLNESISPDLSWDIEGWAYDEYEVERCWHD